MPSLPSLPFRLRGKTTSPDNSKPKSPESKSNSPTKSPNSNDSTTTLTNFNDSTGLTKTPTNTSLSPSPVPINSSLAPPSQPSLLPKPSTSTSPNRHTITPLPAHAMENYVFPLDRLSRKMDDPQKTPLVLVSCGSFSPITLLHLRMFETARDNARTNSHYEVVGGYFSPVGDAYRKAGLAPSKHRLAMCDLAVQTGSDWLMVDHWEALHEEYLPTAQVLDHFDEILNKDGGMLMADGTRRHVRISLLAGADLLMTMGIPGVWSEEDLDHILGHYGAWIIERTGTDIEDALEALEKWQDEIWIVNQVVTNDISSTKIRTLLKQRMSITYLVPDVVIRYIKQHNLYEGDAGSTPSLHLYRSNSNFGASTAAERSASFSATHH